MTAALESRIQSAIRECLDHAKRVLYRDVANLAELMSSSITSGFCSSGLRLAGFRQWPFQRSRQLAAVTR